MSNQQKKTPREIAQGVWDKMCSHHGSPSVYISMVEQAIAAEREEVRRIDLICIAERVEREKLREENGRIREALKDAHEELMSLSEDGPNHVRECAERCSDTLTQTPETKRHLKIRNAERAVVNTARHVNSVVETSVSETKLMLGLQKLEWAIQNLDQLQKEQERG